MEELEEEEGGREGGGEEEEKEEEGRRNLSESARAARGWCPRAAGAPRNVVCTDGMRRTAPPSSRAATAAPPRARSIARKRARLRPPRPPSPPAAEGRAAARGRGGRCRVLQRAHQAERCAAAPRVGRTCVAAQQREAAAALSGGRFSSRSFGRRVNEQRKRIETLNLS